MNREAKMVLTLLPLQLLCLAVFASTTIAMVFEGSDPWVDYCYYSPRKGNFSMLAKSWKNDFKKGIPVKKVIFDCSTNDRNATVKLQYFANMRWLDAMKYGRRISSRGWVLHGLRTDPLRDDYVIQRGQAFILKKYKHTQNHGSFRCFAKSKGIKICQKLGYLSTSRLSPQKHMSKVSLRPYLERALSVFGWSGARYKAIYMDNLRYYKRALLEGDKEA